MNSGAFIGYAPIVYEMISWTSINNDDDDQSFYTKLYLNDILRNKWNIKLNHRSKLFQNLNGAFGEIELKFKQDDSYVENNFYHTQPKIIHGNGASKIHINSLGNYLAKSWTLESGCLSCHESESQVKVTTTTSSLDEENNVIQSEDDGDDILVCLFIEHTTPFLEEFFQDIERLNLSKDRMSVRIHSSQKYHRKHIEDFDRTRNFYHSIKLLDESIPEWQARNLCL